MRRRASSAALCVQARDTIFVFALLPSAAAAAANTRVHYTIRHLCRAVCLNPT